MSKTQGGRAVSVGVGLLLVSFGIAVVGSILTLGRLDQSAFTRDVVIDGPRHVDVPGRLIFEVAEPLSENAPSKMRVGLGVTSGAADPECELRLQEGDVVSLSAVSAGETFIKPGEKSMVPIRTTRLSPGRYEMSCKPSDRASDRPTEFTVGRVVGFSAITNELSPVLWWMGALFVAGLFFLTGGVTLVVGLVKRTRARKSDSLR